MPRMKKPSPRLSQDKVNEAKARFNKKYQRFSGFIGANLELPIASADTSFNRDPTYSLYDVNRMWEFRVSIEPILENLNKAQGLFMTRNLSYFQYS